MELINNEYIKLDRLDIFGGQIEAFEENNKQKSKYYSNLIALLFDYEEVQKKFLKSIYINKESSLVKKYINFDNIVITRQTIINALLLAMINDETDIALNLQPFLKKNKIFINDLGDLLNYVLEHSIDINEYFNGEQVKIIYNEQSNSFENGYIYNNDELKNVLIDSISDITNTVQKENSIKLEKIINKHIN